MNRAKYLINSLAVAPIHRAVLNPILKLRSRGKPRRNLELGPGGKRIPGFETLNIVSGRRVDYIGNASVRLPFDDDTFDIIYASHIIEHIPWYQVQSAVSEWVRALKPGGVLEVWTPNGLAIAKAFVEAEERGTEEFHNDGWWRFNEGKDPCLWMSGRCFSYGDGTGGDHPNWHRALFSPRHLRNLFANAGLVDIREMDRSQVRGYDHGWINLGVRGAKPEHAR